MQQGGLTTALDGFQALALHTRQQIPCQRGASTYDSTLRRASAEMESPGSGANGRDASHLCLAHYGPGLIGYQTGARVVRRAQE